jgi:hypothetical protein
VYANSNNRLDYLVSVLGLKQKEAERMLKT